MNKFTIDSSLPNYGDKDYVGDIYDIVMKHETEKASLSDLEKLTLLKSISFKLNIALMRCPKYMRESAKIHKRAIETLIKDI